MNRDWEEGLPWLLLVAREVCQECIGFHTNDLRVRSPLAVLPDKWIVDESMPSLI